MMIKLEHVRKEYPNVTPLKDVNVEIHEGDVISVIGPSGTGKSTLLRCINMLEKPTSGKIWVHGKQINAPDCNISQVRQKMGMVFQSFNLFPHLTVIENIMQAPTDLLKKSRQEAFEDGMRLLKMVGLPDKYLNYPEQLSGGQKQRIAIARTLAMDPEIILLDEPTSALDPTMVGEVQAVIRELARSGKTMMIVTHEMDFARAICNRVFYMDEGGVYEDGPPEQIFDHPERTRTRRFVQRLKVLELLIEPGPFDYPGMLGELQNYCLKTQTGARRAHRIELVFEELLQIFTSDKTSETEMKIAVEYSETEEKAVVIAAFAHKAPELSSLEEALSMKIIKGVTSDIRSEYAEGAEWPGRLILTISD